MQFTQYLLPDGRTRSIFIDRPEETESLAKALTVKGVLFEAEILTTGLVSFTAEMGDYVLAIEIVENGPNVLAAVDRLVQKAFTELAS